MVYSRILNIITSFFYISTISEQGNLRKPANMITGDFVPRNQKETFFISYKNNMRKDVRYKDGKFEELV